VLYLRGSDQFRRLGSKVQFTPFAATTEWLVEATMLKVLWLCCYDVGEKSLVYISIPATPLKRFSEIDFEMVVRCKEHKILHS